MKQIEAQEQAKVISWAWHGDHGIHELKLLFHIPNGGRRDLITAIKLKAQGAKKGVFDLFLPVARGCYHGLWIEMKAPKGKPTCDQLIWHSEMTNQGYAASFCFSADEAIDTIKKYMAIDKTNAKHTIIF